MQKPIITLKNLKTMPSLSEETTAYTATVYVDGVKLCEASNTGQGGEDRFHPVAGKTYADIAEVEARIKATYPKFDLSEGLGQIDMDLSLVISEVMAEAEWLKDYRRTTKSKVLYIKPGEKAVYQMKIVKGRALEEHYAFLRGKTPDAIILNEKPEAEGLALYKANVQQRL
jgi:hypothetical protein